METSQAENTPKESSSQNSDERTKAKLLSQNSLFHTNVKLNYAKMEQKIKLVHSFN